jgi:uncharacterized protein (TIGR02118 family)
MIKQILLLKRRPGMSLEEFRNYYETHHVKIVEKYMTSANRYVRRYVKPQKNPMTGERSELDFDVMTEIWWESKADMEAAGKEIAAANLHAVIHADEEKLFASHNNRTFTVDECDSDLRPQN